MRTDSSTGSFPPGRGSTDATAGCTWDTLMQGVRWQALSDRIAAPHPDFVIQGVSHDSRRVKAGDVFVAVSGHEADGNQFAPEAVNRGAVAVVTDRPEALPPVTVPVVVVDQVRPALARMAANFYGHPARRLDVIGVTGTLGKTSTADFLYSVLARAGPEYKPAFIGSLGIRYGSHHEVTGLTTPDSVTLQRSLAAMLAAGVRVVVMEVSSHAQLQSRVGDIPFAMGVLLNLVPGEHTDVHPTFEHYAATKMRLLSQIRPGGLLLYNAGDPEVAKRISPGGPGSSLRSAAFRVGDGSHGEGNGPPTLFMPLDDSPTLTFVARERFPLLGGGTRPPVRLQLPWRLRGAQSRVNALAAVAAALALGVDERVIARELSFVLPPPRRMQEVYRGPFRVVDDTTGHPASFEVLFRWLASSGAPGIVLVTAVRGNRGVEINRANARTIGEWSKRVPLRHLVVTAAVDATEPRDRVRPEEWEAFRSEILAHRVPVQFFHALDPALRAALSEVRTGEILVLAGAQGLDQAVVRLRRWLPASLAATPVK